MDVLVGPASPRGGLFIDVEEEEEKGCSSSVSSSSSSSIGVPDDDNSQEEEVEEDGVVSSGGALDSLEDSLPFKRGLSNYFSGKSKSFGNLSEVSLEIESVKDVEKPENPFNKKRRILLANKWASSSSSKKSSFYTWHNPKSMPLLVTLQEDLKEEEDDHPIEGLPIPSSCSCSSSSSSSMEKIEQQPNKGKSLLGDRLEVRSFKLSSNNTSRVKVKSQSCFSLTDLQ